jgi:hypothetical protein
MLIIFNGPPGSGKDEACQFLAFLYGFKHMSFKDKLFEETIKFFGVSREWFFQGYEGRSKKETPEELLNGLSRREALIFVSEDIIKPRYGSDYFGKVAAENIDSVSDYCFSDGGFIDEITPIINRIGKNNMCIVQLYRQGCCFKNDSRNYINGIFQDELILGSKTDIISETSLQLPVRMYRIHTNASLGDFHQAIRTILRKETNVYKKSSLFRKSV